VAYNFQNDTNKIKLLMEYESVTQKVLYLIESILQEGKQLQHARLSWHASCFILFFRFENYRLRKRGK
jgi:hypothetical protein